MRRVPSQRPAQRLGLTVATEQGRLLSPATVQRVLAATSSFFDWAIAAEQYASGDNPMQRRIDHALGRVSDRHQPFVGAASRQQPVRRTVRVRLPLRLPRPMTREDIEALLASLTTLRDLAIFLLMLDGGLRPGEVLCLQLDDISYGRRRVTIRKRDDHPRGARAKARHERVVDLHEPRTLDAVSRYVLHERPIEAESPFVFLVGGAGARRCEPLSYQAVVRGSPAGWTGSGSAARRRPRMRCGTRTRRRCGRAGCGSWRCSGDSGTPRRSRSASTPGSPTSRSWPTTTPRWPAGRDRRRAAGPASGPAAEVRRVHVDRATYRAWLGEHMHQLRSAVGPDGGLRRVRRALAGRCRTGSPRRCGNDCTTGTIACAGSTRTAAPASSCPT